MLNQGTNFDNRLKLGAKRGDLCVYVERMAAYYDSDFSWEEHAAEKGGDEALDALPPVTEEESVKLKSSSQQAAWDEFYQHHHRGKFFKDRKYLPAEFPELLETAKGDGQHYTLIEFGCGYGCSIIPIVGRNHTIRCVGCDMSREALAIFASRAQYQEHASRLTLVQHDAVTGPPLLPLVPCCADLLLMTFFLSAIAPVHHASVMARAWDVMQPGGLLLFRDYGLFDKSQMKSSKRVGPNLHVRPDGTLAYFFSKETVAKLVSGEGWELLECRYATVEQVNRKTGAVIRRVFVHAKARKRLSTASSRH